MGRLVRIPKPLSGADLPRGVLGPGVDLQSLQVGDSYLERITKYVPAETLAFFIVINAILAQAMKNAGPDAAMAGFPVMTVAAGALIVGTALTPLFIWYVRQEGDAWLLNAVVSTLAFPFWAYAIGAVAFTGHWDGNLAAIVLASFTVISGLVAPRARRKAKEASAAVAPSRTDRPQLDVIENRM